MNGKVKRLTDRGFGFIVPDDCDNDVFFHAKELQGVEFNDLASGDHVSFEIIDSPKGPNARYVSRDHAVNNTDKEVKQLEGDFIALALFGNKINVVSVTPDGEVRYIDGLENSHSIIYVASETLALQNAIDELESLVNNPNTKENDLQGFFERNSDFIINDEYKDAHPHVVLTKDDGETLIPDFVLEPLDQPELCDLLELKLPSVKLCVLQKNRIRFSASVFEACAQLREYANYFEEDKYRKRIKDKYRLSAYRPKLFVIIGRRGDVSPIDVRRMEADIPNINVKSYDDIFVRMNAKIDAMKKGKFRRLF